MSDIRNKGDAWVTAADGNKYWGRYGAAGLVAYDRSRDAIVMQHRVDWSDHGGTWGIPGGARHEGEHAVAAAIRESQEEAGIPDGAVRPIFTHLLDRVGWTYTTLIAETNFAFEPRITDPESHALAWVEVEEVESFNLHPAFAASWPTLRPLMTLKPTIILDAMNIVGAVPDGWWKDRKAANVRLRDRTELLAREGAPVALAGVAPGLNPGLARVFPNWLMVLEGQAVGIPATEHVRTFDAQGLGDDMIVQLTRERSLAGEAVTVVTSDVELQARVVAAGAFAVKSVSPFIKLLPVPENN